MPKTTRKKKSTGRKRATPKTLHASRFPGENSAYRKARDQLLKAEVNLRRCIEAVAAQRRKLRVGGEVPQDYVFEAVDELTGIRRIAAAAHPGVRPGTWLAAGATAVIRR
ncbi:MAG: DUF899 family protein [Gammaproteobacteria bacterium]